MAYRSSRSSERFAIAAGELPKDLHFADGQRLIDQNSGIEAGKSEGIDGKSSGGTGRGIVIGELLRFGIEIARF